MKKIKDLKLPFALKNGMLVQVFDVERGLNCGCVCPACNQSLIARKGKKVIHHFAHNKRADCEKALETSLHLAAKKVIEESGYLFLPNVENDIFYMRSQELAPITKFYFDKIILEKKYDDFVPDILLERNGKLLCVEIFVTHKIDEIKKKKIEKSDVSTIEINLSNVDRTFNFENLKSLVVESLENKSWVYSAKKEKLREHILNISSKKKIISRGYAQHVDGCPLPARVWRGKPYANFIDDCLGCVFFVPPKDIYRQDIMYCIGNKTEGEIKKLLRF